MTDKEINKIEKNKKVEFCYIYKRGYYRPNGCGYTDFVTKAGVYKKEDAVRQARNVRELVLIPIDIAEHNSAIMEEVNDLTSRYIFKTNPL